MTTLSPSRRFFAHTLLLCTIFIALFFSAKLSAGISSVQPNPVYPANNTVLKCPNATVVLRWNDIADVSTYFIVVASDVDMKNHVYQKVVQFDTTLSIALPTSAITYYWTVSTGSETSAPAKFSTAFVQKVDLSSLFHGAELSSDVVHFTWKADDAASSYTFEYRCGGEQVRDTIMLGTSADIVVPREQLIVWHVRSVCKTAVGEWSDSDSLRIAKLASDVSLTNDAGSLQVFPQPASTSLHVRCAANFIDSKTEVNAVDQLGRRMTLPAQWNATGCVVNTQSLTPGLYFLQLHSATMHSGCFVMIQE